MASLESLIGQDSIENRNLLKLLVGQRLAALKVKDKLKLESLSGERDPILWVDRERLSEELHAKTEINSKFAPNKKIH